MVFGIATREPPEFVQRYADQLELSFPILLDGNGEALRAYDQTMAFPTAAYPQDWIIGPDGTIVYANNRFELAELTTVLDRLLEE